MLSIKLQNKLLFSFVVSCLSSPAWGAACCGGGFALPSIVSGDDKAQVTTSFSNAKVDTDVTPAGAWYKRQASDVSQIIKLDAAHIWNDRYQAGFSIPIQHRLRDGAGGGESSGLGDVSLQGAYEYLPDWDYNPWRPRGVGFLTLTLPTGKSIDQMDTTNNYGMDSTGRGLWAVGFGTGLTKSWVVWDANFNLEGHRSFDKTVNSAQMQGTLKPGWGGSWGFGAGYNRGNFRFGGSLSWTQEDPIDVVGTTPSSGDRVRYATGTASMSYLFPEQWAGTVSFSDQTLFGNPTNTTLTKSIAVTIQKRWMR